MLSASLTAEHMLVRTIRIGNSRLRDGLIRKVSIAVSPFQDPGTFTFPLNPRFRATSKARAQNQLRLRSRTNASAGETRESWVETVDSNLAFARLRVRHQHDLTDHASDSQ